jgi:hypothetical protein
MQTLLELERQAMGLSETDRATLAAHLLDSLPPVLADEDDGVAEAIRRDAELERDPAAALTLAELRRSLRS